MAFLIWTPTKKLFLQTIEETKGIHFEIRIWGVISCHFNQKLPVIFASGSLWKDGHTPKIVLEVCSTNAPISWKSISQFWHWNGFIFSCLLIVIWSKFAKKTLTWKKITINRIKTYCPRFLAFPKLSIFSHAHLWLLLFLQITLFIYINLGPDWFRAKLK